MRRREQNTSQSSRGQYACVVQESYGHTLVYGLTMVAALNELAPVLHVNTFQQERGDSFSCGIWATWNKTILDWYIELEVQVTLRDIQNPPPAPADLMLLAGSSRLAICSTTMSPQLHLGSRIS